VSNCNLHAHSELQRIRLIMPELLAELERRLRGQSGASPFPVLRFGQEHQVSLLSSEEAGLMDEWFFIGDLHGDFFALHTFLQHAKTLHPACRIFFLGDIVDRGVMPLECLFLLLEWGLHHPGRLAWIAGNHDVAFSIGEDGVFTSAVSPSEFLRDLNENDALAGTRRRIGRFFVEVASRLPRALLFPDGLLATHGGFPLSDLHAEGMAIKDESSYLDWLNSVRCLKDFTWTRITRWPKKLPDRYSSGSQYGFKDFEAFCQLQPQWFPVTHMITGHEHPKEGYDLHVNFKVNRALTLAGLGFNEYLTSPASYHSYNQVLHLGRGVPKDIPAVLTIQVDTKELELFMPAILAASRMESSNLSEVALVPA
jgi:hypothetical protein